MRPLRNLVFGLVLSGAATFLAQNPVQAAACVDGNATAIIGTPCTVNGGTTTLTITSIAGFTSGPAAAGIQVAFVDAINSFSVTFFQTGPTFGFRPANTANGANVVYTLSGGLTLFNQVNLDSQQVTPSTSVTKRIAESGTLLQSLGGSTSSGSFINLNFLTVTDAIFFAAGPTGTPTNGVLFSFSNEFVAAPEPATLALLGASLAAFGWARRRKRS